MIVCLAHTATACFKRRRNNGGKRRARVRRERFWLGWRWCMLDEVEDNELFDADAHLAAQIFEDSDSRSCVKSITIENLLMNCEHWRMKFTWQEKKNSRTSKAVFISQNTVYLEFSVFSNSKFHYNVKSNSISLFFYSFLHSTRRLRIGLIFCQNGRPGWTQINNNILKSCAPIFKLFSLPGRELN